VKERFQIKEIIPLPPRLPEVQKIQDVEVAEILKGSRDIRLLYVRSLQEREQASIENCILLDQELVEEMRGFWDLEAPLMFYCHVGQRSRQAAQYFTSQGFQQVYNISDGISGWSSSVDSSIPQY
jgi:Rhodanese-related sulfurtransferase